MRQVEILPGPLFLSPGISTAVPATGWQTTRASGLGPGAAGLPLTTTSSTGWDWIHAGSAHHTLMKQWHALIHLLFRHVSLYAVDPLTVASLRRPRPTRHVQRNIRCQIIINYHHPGHWSWGFFRWNVAWYKCIDCEHQTLHPLDSSAVISGLCSRKWPSLTRKIRQKLKSPRKRSQRLNPKPRARGRPRRTQRSDSILGDVKTCELWMFSFQHFDEQWAPLPVRLHSL